MENHLMYEISSKNEIWKLLFHKNQEFQKINDRNWARERLAPIPAGFQAFTKSSI